MDNNNKWDELSLTEKSEIMKQAVANGITDLNEIKQTYNEYANGGKMYDDGGVTSTLHGIRGNYNGTVNSYIDGIYANGTEESYGNPSDHYNNVDEEKLKQMTPNARGHYDDSVKLPNHPSSPTRGTFNGQYFDFTDKGFEDPNYTMFGLQDNGDGNAIMRYNGAIVIPELTVTPNGNYYDDTYNNIKIHQGHKHDKKRINEYRRLQGQSPLSLVSPTPTPLPWEESILYKPQLPIEIPTEQPVIAADGGYLFKGGGYIPSASIKRDIANFEGSSMKTNRSFEAEAKDFNKVIPLAIRNKLSQKQLDALYSYGYNVGMGNLKNRVLPTLTAYTQGKAGADDVAASMWASKDIYMRGLRRRRTYERNMFTGNSPVGTRESIVSRAINMDLSGLPTVVKFSGDTPKFQYDLFPLNPTNYGTPIDWSTPEKKIETPTIIPKEDNNELGLLALINQIYDSPKQEPLATYTPQKDNNMFVVNALSSSKNDTLLDNMWFSKGDYLYNDRGSSLLFNSDKYLN